MTAAVCSRPISMVSITSRGWRVRRPAARFRARSSGTSGSVASAATKNRQPASSKAGTPAWIRILPATKLDPVRKVEASRMRMNWMACPRLVRLSGTVMTAAS